MDLDNDFMEYLKKTMISGMGIPSSMLNYADELEFSRSVSMQNGMFLRQVVVKQKKLTSPFSSMYQDLYENEFGNDVIYVIDKNKKTDSNEEKNVDKSLIKVQFPSPASLNSTNLSEQISVGTSIVQAITDAKFDPNGENTDTTHKFNFVKELNKKYIPNIDWDSVDEIFETTKTKSIEDKIESKIKKSSSETE